MKMILLLRSISEKEVEDKYHIVFKREQLNASSISPIDFNFINLEQLAESIRTPSQFSGIIFSSPRTVQAVEQSISKIIGSEKWTNELKPRWKTLPAFTVGTSTSGNAKHLGFDTFGEDSGNAENLAKVIIDKITANQPPLLFPCGTLKRDVIPKKLTEAGVKFTSCTVYETCPNSNLRENIQELIAKEGLPHAVAFFSPSGVRFSSVVLKELGIFNMEACKYFAIGQTTATAMKEAGINISGVAVKPTPESLLNAMLENT